jgi:hypothetical protein
MHFFFSTHSAFNCSYRGGEVAKKKKDILVSNDVRGDTRASTTAFSPTERGRDGARLVWAGRLKKRESGKTLATGYTKLENPTQR